MVAMSKGMTCTICGFKVIASETPLPVISIRSLKYYQNWQTDNGSPVLRRKHFWCPECSARFIDWFDSQLGGDFVEDEASS